MFRRSRCLVVLALLILFAGFSAEAEPQKSDREASKLRLLDAAIFGKATTQPVVLLQPMKEGQLDPDTVMVDINKGVYYAATVQYPKKMSLADARRSLNTLYAKYEKKDFANDPSMGLWRNEDDKFSIQLTEDDDYLVVIYLKFSLITEDQLMKARSAPFERKSPPKRSHNLSWKFAQ